MFLAHCSEIPLNYKKPLKQFNDTKAIVHRDDGFYLIDNVCPHQGSIIISSLQKSMICQYHGWSWNDKGEPLGSGKTSYYSSNKSCLKLEKLFVWNDLIFTNTLRDIENFNLNFAHMELVDSRIDRVNSNPKNIVDVFLDVDHIPVVHTGVYDEIGLSNINSVTWKYFEWGNIQLVEDQCSTGEFSSTIIEEEKYNSHGAVWLCVYPNSMIEWQPGALFVTVALPTNNNGSNVLVFKYKDIRYSNKNWNINNNVWETAWEQDRTQASRIIQNTDSNLEESKIHFRNFLLR
jgi:phenylpropionate dioxygenase-like ring-hydroxylating dioxygenase large terminal subunit